MSIRYLFYWISLVVFLCADAEETSRDYSKICEQCKDSEKFPECSAEELLQHNRTVYCEHLMENPCVFGIVEATAGSDDTDFICLVKNGAAVAEEAIPTAEKLQTMESIEMEQKLEAEETPETEAEVKPENVEVNSETEIEVKPETETEGIPETEENSDGEEKPANVEKAEENSITEIEVKPEMEEKPQTEDNPESEDKPEDAGKPEVEETSKNDNEVKHENKPETEGQPETVDNPETVEKPEDEEISEVEANSEVKPEMEEKPQTDIDKSETEKVDTTENEADVKPNESLDYQADAADATKPIENTIDANDGVTEAESVAENVLKPSESTTESVENSNAVNNEEIDIKPDDKPMENDLNNEPQVSLSITKCFSCTSADDANCINKPNKQLSCKAMDNGPNGCYTLLKADAGLTTRGCISDLTEEGKIYCKVNKKQCSLCYETGCNSRKAPTNGAAKHLISVSFAIFLGAAILKILLENF